jgi:tetratricopeptide (TPR) repeat protein
MDSEGEYESAIQYFEKALAIDPNDGFSYGNLKSTQMNYAYLSGDYEKWFELWGEKVKGNWKEECRMAVLNAFQEKGHIAGIEEMFKMHATYGNEGARMDEAIKFERYLKLGETDKAMGFLEKGVEKHDMEMAYLATYKFYDHLKDNPRYMELLKKMNLNQ